MHNHPALPIKQLVHQTHILHGPFVLILGLFNLQPVIVDRDRTVLQRSKPSSCFALAGEQTYPYGRFQS